MEDKIHKWIQFALSYRQQLHGSSRGLLTATVLDAKLKHTCQNISACISLHMHGRLSGARGLDERARSHGARQLPVAAADRHSTALISWPVTGDTHSCAALREQAERRQRLQGAVKTQTLMDTSKTSVIAFRIKDATSCCCLRGRTTALHTSLW